MRAARFHGVDRPVVVEDVPRPEPGPGEVLVRVAAAGVCGTELHFLDGLLSPATTPITLGHEVAGTVAATGPGVTGLTAGDRVAVHYLHSCGCGGVGLALVQVLRLRGVRVLAVSRSAEKLRLARELGADVPVDATAGPVGEQVREATRGAGADAVFELVGTADTGGQSLAALGKRGALVYVGYSFDRIALDPLALVVPEQRVLTSVGNTHAELAQAVDLAARGLLRTVVHETTPLDDVGRVLDDLRAGRVAGRSVLLPSGPLPSGAAA